MTRQEKIALARAMEEKDLRRAERDVWYWLRNHTKTEDEQDKKNPIKPFPDREYFPLVFDVMKHEHTVMLEKSRTMMASWMASAYCAHEMFTAPFTGVVFQSKDEARALKCIHYVKTLWRHSTPRLKSRWEVARPLERQPYNRMEMANGSWALGVAGDPDRIRSEHPTIVVLDEAAFIDTSDNYDTAVATRCLKIFCISSANPGWFREMTKDARPEQWPKYDNDLTRLSA